MTTTNDSDRPQLATGALPPPNHAWQVGKTAGSIVFVKDAERLLAGDLDGEVESRLKEAVRQVKEGEVVLTTRVTAQDFLNDGFPD